MSLDDTIRTPTETGLGPGAEAGARILIVDNQLANIQVVGTMLGKLGYEIVPAYDGPTALKRLALRIPDLILLDVLMPVMDGFEVCRRIRENPQWKDIPIIFLSAADDKGLIVRALESGGVDYVVKPFNHAELVSRVRTHLALKQARDRLKQLAEDKDELLGILAHDLRNGLGGIQMSAQVLVLKVTNDEKLGRVATNIYHSSARLLSFVKEFLANAATDHQLSLKIEPVSLSSAANRTAQQHQEAARRKNLGLHLELPKLPIVVLADRIALDHILDNLLSNAVKFSPPQKEIRIQVRPGADSQAELLVMDQGPGFTSEDLARMFRRYGRLSARPTAGEPSTGLGLSIVRKLVDALHGQVTCQSEPGHGATFLVRLPLAPSSH